MKFYSEPLFVKDTHKILERNNSLFAFVGRPVSLVHLPDEEGSIDNGFLAKYEVLVKVYGNYNRDKIEFVAYDHYGIPAFSKFENVLLYVSKGSKGYYH